MLRVLPFLWFLLALPAWSAPEDPAALVRLARESSGSKRVEAVTRLVAMGDAGVPHLVGLLGELPDAVLPALQDMSLGLGPDTSPVVRDLAKRYLGTLPSGSTGVETEGPEKSQGESAAAFRALLEAGPQGIRVVRALMENHGGRTFWPTWSNTGF
jgi:hypothetical protein